MATWADISRETAKSANAIPMFRFPLRELILLTTIVWLRVALSIAHRTTMLWRQRALSAVVAADYAGWVQSALIRS